MHLGLTRLHQVDFFTGTVSQRHRNVCRRSRGEHLLLALEGPATPCGVYNPFYSLLLRSVFKLFK